MTMTFKTREQVVLQCRVVADLAGQLAGIHDKMARLYADTGVSMDQALVDCVGQSTASIMEEIRKTLGKMGVPPDDPSLVIAVCDVAQATWPRSTR